MDAELLKLAKYQAEICSVFGNTTRLLIFWSLGEQEMSVGDIAAAVDSSLQNTSQHLRLMKDRGILISRKEGQTVYYRVNKQNDLLEGCRIVTLAHTKAADANKKDGVE